MKRNLRVVCALSLTGLLLFSLGGCGGDKKETARPGAQKLTIYVRRFHGGGCSRF